MQTRDFDFELPQELIAQFPLPERSGSRLLYLDGASGELQDRQFCDLPCFLRAGDVLVFNDTRVINARLHGVKDSGGRVEVLVERVVDERHALAHIRASQEPRPNSGLLLEGKIPVAVLEQRDNLCLLQFAGDEPVLDLLERHGRLPLPPYITHAPNELDQSRYQTVYARQPGAVAAPTAGLHFTGPLLARLRERGVRLATVTLHVGPGTFLPIHADEVDEHRMEPER